MSVKIKLQVILLAVSLGSSLVFGYLSWSGMRDSLTETAVNQLISIRDAKAQEVETYFKHLRRHLRTLCEDPLLANATREFATAYATLDQAAIPPQWDLDIREYYNTRFFPRLAPKVEGVATFETYAPVGQAARYLQHQYLVAAPQAADENREPNQAGVDDAYRRLHQRYDPFFRQLTRNFDYDDLFLIDLNGSNIVYSAGKKTDFATNLKTGPYRNSQLAEVAEAVRNNPEQGAIQLTDFKPYRPAYAAPVAFVAGPIYDGPHLLGILAVQLSADRIKAILAEGHYWHREHFDDTGQLYLIGADLRVRAMARSTDGDPVDSLPPQRMDTPAAQATRQGEANTRISRDYHGAKVLSAYAPLHIEGLPWAILAELPLEGVYRPIHVLERRLLIATATLMLFITVIAGLTAYYFVRPIKAMISATQDNAGVEKLERFRDEFGELALHYNGKVRYIHQQVQRVELENQNLLKLLSHFLPPDVISRLNAGETRFTERVPGVTVLFAVISNLAALAAAGDDVPDRLSALLDAFAEAALEYDVERLRFDSGRYVVVCGLSKPYLDHEKRVVEFALKLLEVVQGFNSRGGPQFKLAMGIHTGEVLAGTFGTHHLSYDLWGTPVAIADYLSTRAQPDTILITQTVYERLHGLEPFGRSTDIDIFPDGSRLATWVLKKRWLQSLIGDLTNDLEIDDL